MIRWLLDYYILYALYPPYKVYKYHAYMLDKYGDTYRKHIHKRSNRRW